MESMPRKFLVALTLMAGAIPFTRAALPDQHKVTDAYVYLLGRAIVIRQEQADLKESGVTYNEPGGAVGEHQ